MNLLISAIFALVFITGINMASSHDNTTTTTQVQPKTTMLIDMLGGIIQQHSWKQIEKKNVSLIINLELDTHTIEQGYNAAVRLYQNYQTHSFGNISTFFQILLGNQSEEEIFEHLIITGVKKYTEMKADITNIRETMSRIGKDDVLKTAQIIVKHQGYKN